MLPSRLPDRPQPTRARERQTSPFRTPGLLAVAIAMASVTGRCILFVSPATGTTTCAFTGSSSLCGACVQTSCQTAVNACCGDPSCTAVSDLESCATQHGSACNVLQSGAEGGDAGTTLASCLAENCRGECQAFSGSITTACSDSDPGFSAGTACSCQLADSNAPADNFVCSAAAYPGTICCAPEGWPSPGIQCSCLVLGCDFSQEGCECDLVNFTPTMQTCSTNRCCAYQDGCSCRASGCYEYETKVDACAIGKVTCPTGEVQVASCSIEGGPGAHEAGP